MLRIRTTSRCWRFRRAEETRPLSRASTLPRGTGSHLQESWRSGCRWSGERLRLRYRFDGRLAGVRSRIGQRTCRRSVSVQLPARNTFADQLHRFCPGCLVCGRLSCSGRKRQSLRVGLGQQPCAVLQPPEPDGRLRCRGAGSTDGHADVDPHQHRHWAGDGSRGVCYDHFHQPVGRYRLQYCPTLQALHDPPVPRRRALLFLAATAHSRQPSFRPRMARSRRLSASAAARSRSP